MTQKTYISNNGTCHDNGHLTDIDSQMASDLEMIARTFELLRSPNPDMVTELRILNTPRSGTVSGYFTNINEFVAYGNSYSGRVPGIYSTLNPVHPDLLARANNRVEERAKHTTSDSDIIRRFWLPIDLDPVRPSGISASNDEHEAALSLGQEVKEWLRGLGWPPGIFADSGNGAHLLFRIDLPNDEFSTTLIKKCLEALDLHFSNDAVNVDLTTFNAARIWKLYGTKACKGDHLPDRPHRMAKLIDVPETLSVVSLEQLKRLAAMVPEAPKPKPQPRKNGKHTSFDLEQWIEEHNLPVVNAKEWNGGRMWILNPCPWNPEHTNKAAFITQFPNGAIGAGCHHNGCADKNWQALRELYEPDWPNHGYQESSPDDASTSDTTDTTSATHSTEHHTDLGNAKRLVARHGQDLLHCMPWDKWLIWDGIRWTADQTGEVIRRAKETVLSIYDEARQFDSDACKALMDHAKRSESEPRIKAMINLAKSELRI